MKASPPGLNGLIFAVSYVVTRGVSVSPGPSRWVNPGPAHTPVKFGRPSGVRGIVCPCRSAGMKARIANRHEPQRHRDTKGTGAIEDDSGTDNEIKRRISMSVPRLLRPPLCLCVFVVPVISTT